ncbi:hypothetical protein LJC22_02240 [Desulfosarcina sp. OttesenSCG-928-G10]|nr:hypothetical protein [Desulfosarcina sp. OttesenSCG-928-G10]MDL2321431.1 hypothetical protein [Desulfosarcina sp. OttesenSCG-928-B08]
MKKRPLTPSYLFFYVLLSEDTWRILAGFILAVCAGPGLAKGQNLAPAAEAMVWVMLLAIGWAISAWPARKISAALQRAIRSAARK